MDGTSGKGQDWYIRLMSHADTTKAGVLSVNDLPTIEEIDPLGLLVRNSSQIQSERGSYQYNLINALLASRNSAIRSALLYQQHLFHLSNELLDIRLASLDRGEQLTDSIPLSPVREIPTLTQNNSQASSPASTTTTFSLAKLPSQALHVTDHELGLDPIELDSGEQSDTLTRTTTRIPSKKRKEAEEIGSCLDEEEYQPKQKQKLSKGHKSALKHKEATFRAESPIQTETQPKTFLPAPAAASTNKQPTAPAGMKVSFVLNAPQRTR